MPEWRRFPALNDPRIAVAAILTSYVALGITVLGFNRSPAQLGLTVGTAMVLDMALHRVLIGGLLFPLSAYITGMGLTILMNYAHGWWFSLVPVFLAIGSKYVFTFKGRHVYNPALFGVVASLLLAERMISESPAYQWGGSYAIVAFVLTGALMLLVLPIRRRVLILCFLSFYFIALAVRAWLTRWQMPPETWFLGTLTSPAFYLFTFFMITDPQTSPNSHRGQVLMAFSIVLIDFILHLRQSLSTLFYAAFAFATLRFAWMHAQALWGDWRETAARLRAALPRWTVVGALGTTAWAAHGHWAVPPPVADIAFRLDPVDVRAAGIGGSPSDILERLDPRITHVAKWLLAVGDAVAVADVDNDGLQDIFLTYPLKDAADRGSLYRNLGGFRFERIPLPALDDMAREPEKHGLITGALFIDYDGDGDQDLLVLAGWGRLRLLQNRLVEDGKLAFRDVTRSAGLDEYTISFAVNALDINRDGRLDIVVGQSWSPLLPDYPTPTPFNVFGLPRPEYDGDRRMFNFMHRTWHDAANGGGVSVFMGQPGGFARADERALGLGEKRWTLAIGAGDLDNDGWPDLYLANDFGPDQLLINRAGRGFETVKGSVIGEIGRDTYKGMNASLGDIDGNGTLDIYVSNVHHRLQAEGSLLWMNAGGATAGAWSDQATSRNALNERRFGWGAAIGDLDRDGLLDIVQANGLIEDTYDHKYPGCPGYWYWNDKIANTPPDVHGYADRWADLRGRCMFPRELNRIYLNRGARFADVAAQVGWTVPGTSRGVALVDLDNDGTLDVVVTHQYAPVSIYRNVGTVKPWIGIALEGNARDCNRDAIGTRVWIDAGGRRQMREVHAANGFSAQGDRRLLFGLGEHPGRVSAEIYWCGSREPQRVALEANRYQRLRQP